MRAPDGCACLSALLALVLAAAAQAQPATGAGPQRIAALSPADRAALERRAEAWEALPEPMRRERRETWLAWRALPADERARMHAAREAWLALPVAEQQALRARFDALDAGLRRGWLLGPVLGADWPQLHALFAQVGPDERDALLDALRALPPQARADLGVLAQRTPPQERAALREALMAQPPAQRGAWLRRRVSP
ncbi:DUF3106 domain-containing protein [Luteimonas kalidii]|uniref:DUF3106 domain-containing protein n=1 Tax=Luteimonas kalidii TaxID=3042025 RepID=A0ABT6JUC9_9GAMM|nr:DUF3106 domain-containing protein [Luteimonas kalidii]MDH5834288.1 DUF3106 domain-containing protein [Luteimonas kalidii]